tara:strand:+ start:989 stop:1150 length:162 start_codon:yes stop_codon:yes gene_type:complete
VVKKTEINFDSEELEERFESEASEVWLHVYESKDGYLAFDVVHGGVVVGSGEL